MQFSDFCLKHASLDETENKQADGKKKPQKKQNLMKLDILCKQNPNMMQTKQAINISCSA